MITSNVYYRVFFLKYGTGIGTCFSIDVDNKQYLITARHVIDGIKDGDNVQILHENQWKEKETTLIGIGEGLIDIAVFSIKHQISPALVLEPTMEDLTFGQDVYFLGFPHGWYNVLNKELFRDYPVPFIKKGIVSSMSMVEGVGFLFVDGHNNPGFSGGPVVFKPSGKRDFRVAAVISGYRWAPENVHIGDQSLEYFIKSNTGIIQAFDIRHATDLIAVNPKGFLLPVQ
jgi:hypothetical protein